MSRLVAEGKPAHFTAEPSTGPIGRVIRDGLRQVDAPPSPELMALLFAADRLDHVSREVEPLLAQGTHVLTDRYRWSSLAYQGSRVPLDWVTTLNRAARRPDLTILFDVAPEVALARRLQRGGAVEIYDDLPMQRAVAERYRALAAAAPAAEVVILDAGAGFDDVAAALYEAVRRCLEAAR